MSAIPLGLCQCGCGERTNIAKRIDSKRGHVKGQPVFYVHGHGPRRNGQRYIVDPQTGCWNWNGAITDGGYGARIPTPTGPKAPHRIFYEAAYGPIPEGMQIDHLCRNRRCVNPGHLEPVTPAENVRRGVATKLTSDDVREIRRLLGTTPPSVLARQFGVSAASITLIAKRKNWAEVA